MRICYFAIIKKKVLIFIAISLSLVIGANLLVLSLNRKTAFKMIPPDSIIHLTGIEPDTTGIIYDPNNKKLNIDISTYPQFYFKDDMHIYRTFIFEMNNNEKPPYGISLIINRADDVNSPILDLGWYEPPFVKSDEKTYFYFSLPIPKAEYKRGFWGIRFVKNRNQIANLIIKYYDELNSPAQFKFDGPFSDGQILDKHNGTKCTLTITKQPQDVFNVTYIQIQMNVKVLFENFYSLAAYDKSGNRYQANSSGMGGSGSAAIPTDFYIFFQLKNINLDSIAYITVGEKPKEILYKNVPLYFSQ